MEDRRVLIDTSVIIKFFRSKKKQDTLLWELMESNSCYVSTVTVFELYNGAKEKFHFDTLETIFNQIKIIDFDKQCALESATIYKNLRHRNQAIEFRDIFIAATAIVYEMPVSTLNLKHFNRIENLKLY